MPIDLDVHLTGIAVGDTDAFGAWMAAAEAPLRRGLRAAALRVDVEAVLQETFLRMWQVAPRVVRDAEPNALLRLAHVTARNLVRSELRRARTEPAEPDLIKRALADADLPPVAPDPLLRRVILECLDLLPPRPRTALDARVNEGHAGRTDHELATLVTMTLNTFLQNITRARRLLGECLEACGVAVNEVWR